MTDSLGDALRQTTMDILVELPINRRDLEMCRRAIDAALPADPQRADILKAGWALFDSLAADFRRQPDCRKGCAFCCTLPVQISDVEASLLAAAAAPDGERKRRLKDNARQARGLDTAAHTAALIPCAFLDGDGSCSVWDVRPSACRYWHSIDVKACEAGHGRPYSGVPLHRERVVLFKTMMMAVGLVYGDRFRRRPSLSMGRNGELHAMTLRALEKRRCR